MSATKDLETIEAFYRRVEPCPRLKAYEKFLGQTDPCLLVHGYEPNRFRVVYTCYLIKRNKPKIRKPEPKEWVYFTGSIERGPSIDFIEDPTIVEEQSSTPVQSSDGTEASFEESAFILPMATAPAICITMKISPPALGIGKLILGPEQIPYPPSCLKGKSAGVSAFIISDEDSNSDPGVTPEKKVDGIHLYASKIDPDSCPETGESPEKAHRKDAASPTTSARQPSSVSGSRSKEAEAHLLGKLNGLRSRRRILQKKSDDFWLEPGMWVIVTKVVQDCHYKDSETVPTEQNETVKPTQFLALVQSINPDGSVTLQGRKKTSSSSENEGSSDDSVSGSEDEEEIGAIKGES